MAAAVHAQAEKAHGAAADTQGNLWALSVPSARCDAAGTGNGLTARLVRHSQRKRGATDRPDLRSTAPVLDPTFHSYHKALTVNRVLPMLPVNSVTYLPGRSSSQRRRIVLPKRKGERSQRQTIQVSSDLSDFSRQR